MDSYRRLLLNNKAWVQEKLALTSHFFEDRAKKQKPGFMWIGSSDSRVPAEKVTGTQPGEIYVHRNIGNQVLASDLNMLSALEYAVEELGVKHVIVCGHYDCLGMQVALNPSDNEVLNKWLSDVRKLIEENKDELDAISDKKQKSNRLAEINVISQVQKLRDINIIQKKWKTHQKPRLHGWVYDIETGFLKDIVLIKPENEAPSRLI